MSKVYKLINDIRDTLNDPEGDRWHNDRLIRSINFALRDINQRVRVLRSKGKFQLTTGVSTYTMDMDVQLVTRVIYGNKVLEFKSHDEMDLISDTWETDIGDDIKYIVYDKLNRSELRIYPVIASDITQISSAYGVITSLEGIAFNSPYGIVTSLYEPKGDMVVYFIKQPKEVTGLNDEIDLDDTWDKAIKHYVCGNVLRDDKDTQNRTFGSEELQLYYTELQTAKIDASNNFTTAPDYTTQYRRI
jgi:hypothetical protein